MNLNYKKYDNTILFKNFENIDLLNTENTKLYTNL